MRKRDEIRVLLVEDDANYAILVQEMLAEEGSRGEMFSVTVARRLAEGIQYLKGKRFDLVLLDLGLPDGSGLGNLTSVRAVAADLPVVVLTGSFENEQMALEAVGRGAQDYLFKDGLNSPALVRAIRYAIERDRLDKKLQKSQLSLVQAEKMAVVGQLAAGVAHEVKNPLGIILQGVDFLGKRLPPEGGQDLEVLGMIRSAVERANRIIQGLLHFARVSPAHLEPTEIGELMDSALGLIKKQIVLSKIKIKKEFRESLCTTLDRNQLEQVFINIILNAVQAMPEGGTLSLKTSLDTSDKKESIVCEIGDTGIGISKENLHRVFEPFFTTKPPGSGTGLGLGISKSIVEAHGGSIDMTSEEGKGTVVRIILPKTDCKESAERKT